jgi:hypothetical protein
VKNWTQWEIVRHQVAACGRVLDENAKPVAGAQVAISSMPEEFELKLKSAYGAWGTDWEALDERLDRTRSRAEGIFYFLDLPAGHYTLTGVDTLTGARDEKSVSVKWGSNGKVKTVSADLMLSVN